MNPIELIASFMAVLVVIAAAYALRPRKLETLDAAEARDMAEAMAPGFRSQTAIICSGGTAALVEGKQNDFVVLKNLGQRFAARKLRVPVETTRLSETMLRIDSGERLFGRVELGFPDKETLDLWRFRMAGAGR